MSVPPLRLGDRYQVGDVIGRGGMADVHRAHDTVLDRSVAVKVLRDVNAVDSRRFADEARLLASLDHPHIVRLLDAGVEDERPWIALELVEGTTLRELMMTGPLAPTTAARIGRDVSSALAHAHAAGIVHRDVKPANILLEADGTAKLTDFGIARLDDGSAGITITGYTIGTAAYLAPEQVSGEPMSSAGDVYALGLVLLEALTAVRAYPGPPLEAALARLTVAPLIPASLPTGWHALLTGMTYREIARRPPAQDVARRLQSSRPLPAEESDPPETATVAIATSRRRPTGLVAIAVLLTLVASLVIVRELGEPSPAIADTTTATPTASTRSSTTRPAAPEPPAATPVAPVRRTSPPSTGTVKAPSTNGGKKSAKKSAKKSGGKAKKSTGNEAKPKGKSKKAMGKPQGKPGKPKKAKKAKKAKTKN